MTDHIDLTPPVEPRPAPTRFNALKHGLLSVSPVIDYFEREEDWNAVRDAFFFDMQPHGAVQESIADRIAANSWLLLRCRRYHREIVNNNFDGIPLDMEVADSLVGMKPPKEMTPKLKERMDRMAMGRLLPGADVLNKIHRHETRLHRHILQLLREYRTMKAEDRGRNGRPDDDPDIPALNGHAPNGPSDRSGQIEPSRRLSPPARHTRPPARSGPAPGPINPPLAAR